MPFHVAIPIFPSVTQLDFTGPAQMFAYTPGVQVHVAAGSLKPVATDCGFSVCADTTFDECPDAQLLCVPGGPGVFDALADERLLEFIRRQSKVAEYVTSVCTGMFLLGAVGLLKGKRATSHWGYTDAIETYGATYTPGRVVLDGSLMTAGGVTAGMDYGIKAVAEIFGEEVAKTVQLRLEYDPQPPFDSGHPSKASEQTIASVRGFYREATERMKKAVPDNL